MSAVSKACHLFARGVQHMCSVCVVCEGRSSGGSSSGGYKECCCSFLWGLLLQMVGR